MADSADSFFEGLDDAEEIATPEAPAPEAPAPEAAKPEAAAPEAKAPEAAKPEEKPAEPASREAPSPEKPVIQAPEAKAPETPDPKKWVPVGSHIELRRQLQATQEELQRLKNPPAPAPEKPKPEVPDFVQNPKGYVDASIQAGVQSALEKLEAGLQPVTQTAQQAAQQAAHTQFVTALNTAEQQFAARQPDYYNAVRHLREVRVNELQMLNPGVSAEEAHEFARREELQLAAQIWQSGRNPSEVAYAFAKTRGYSPPKPPEPPAPAPRPAAPEEVAKLVPKVPETPKLAPDLTLGTGTGSPTTDIEEDPFDAAFKEVFGRKRA